MRVIRVATSDRTAPATVVAAALAAERASTTIWPWFASRAVMLSSIARKRLSTASPLPGETGCHAFQQTVHGHVLSRDAFVEPV